MRFVIMYAYLTLKAFRAFILRKLSVGSATSYSRFGGQVSHVAHIYLPAVVRMMGFFISFRIVLVISLLLIWIIVFRIYSVFICCDQVRLPVNDLDQK